MWLPGCSRNCRLADCGFPAYYRHALAVRGFRFCSHRESPGIPLPRFRAVRHHAARACQAAVRRQEGLRVHRPSANHTHSGGREPRAGSAPSRLPASSRSSSVGSVQLIQLSSTFSCQRCASGGCTVRHHWPSRVFSARLATSVLAICSGSQRVRTSASSCRHSCA